MAPELPNLLVVQDDIVPGDINGAQGVNVDPGQLSSNGLLTLLDLAELALKEIGVVDLVCTARQLDDVRRLFLDYLPGSGLVIRIDRLRLIIVVGLPFFNFTICLARCVVLVAVLRHLRVSIGGLFIAPLIHLIE